ncbi:MAG TPA: hypothetical protein VIU46_00335 [Gallionellaceae bacterium]
MEFPPLRKPAGATCHATYSGQGGLVFCLNEDRFICDYCLPFGEVYYCRHPRCVEIAARSEVQKNQLAREEQQANQELKDGSDPQ